MPSSKDGIMVVLSSPSGAGKTTLVNLLSKQENFEISISHTTRQPRPAEISKLFCFESKFTNVVLPAPDGEDRTTIIPSFDEGI